MTSVLLLFFHIGIAASSSSIILIYYLAAFAWNTFGTGMKKVLSCLESTMQ